MKNRILLAIGFSLFQTTSIFAENGFYAGIGGGYANGSSRISSDYSLSVGLDSFKRNDISVHGFQGGVFAGFGRRLADIYYAGLESSADLSTGKGSDKQPLGGDFNTAQVVINTTSLKYRHSLNAAFKGGIFLGEKALLYLKPGISWGNWKFAAKLNDGSSLHKSHLLAGFRTGIGLQYNITANTDISAEYSYTKYKNIKVNQTTKAGIVIPHHIKPALNAFMLSLIRKF